MRRRFLLIAPFTFRLLADARQQVFDLLTSMASALSEGNDVAFMQAIDKSMPNYAQLEANIAALVQQNDVLSSIEVLQDEGDETRRSLELDWFLQLKGKHETGPLERRRERIKCRFERKGKKWKVVSLEPRRFFSPERLTGAGIP